RTAASTSCPSRSRRSPVRSDGTSATTRGRCVPRRLKDIQGTMSAAIGPLAQELGRAPRPSEIAARLGVPVEDVVDGLAAQHAYRNDSLDHLSEAGDASLAKGTEIGR